MGAPLFEQSSYLGMPTISIANRILNGLFISGHTESVFGTVSNALELTLLTARRSGVFPVSVGNMHVLQEFSESRRLCVS